MIQQLQGEMWPRSVAEILASLRKGKDTPSENSTMQLQILWTKILYYPCCEVHVKMTSSCVGVVTLDEVVM